MLIIAQEPSQATEKLRRLLDSFGIQSRVFYTNFETDVDKDTISLAFIPQRKIIKGHHSFLTICRFHYTGNCGLWGLRPTFLMVKTAVPVLFFVTI